MPAGLSGKPMTAQQPKTPAPGEPLPSPDEGSDQAQKAPIPGAPPERLADAFAYCKDLLRAVERDRFFASLFAPEGAREGLWALYAFHHEIAKTAAVVSEPMIGEIRLTWWQEALDEIAAGKQPRAHQVVEPVAWLVSQTALTPADLQALVSLRYQELESEPLQEEAAWLDHAEKTGASLLSCAAQVCGAPIEEPVAREVGRALNLVAGLRQFYAEPSTGRPVLPRAWRPNAFLEDAQEHAQLTGRITGLVEESQKTLRPALKKAPEALFPVLAPLCLLTGDLKFLGRTGAEGRTAEGTLNRSALAVQARLLRASLFGL